MFAGRTPDSLLGHVMHISWPQLNARRPVSREAELDKVAAAERSIALVRLGIVAFGVFLLLALQPATDPLVGWSVLMVGGIYSLWILARAPYRRYPFLLSGVFTTIADAVLVLLWLYSTGGLASNTYVLIYAAIISVAYRYGQRETVLATTGYTLGYLLLGLLMNQLSLFTPDLIVRVAYFIFVGVLSARFSGDALDQVQAKLDLRDLARSLERESAERQRAEQALAAYAEQLEARIEERTQALSQAKEQVESILNSASDGIVFVRLDGQIEHSNRAFCALFGFGMEDVIGQPLEHFVDASDAALLTTAIRSTVDTAAPVRLDVTCRRPDDNIWLAEFVVTPALTLLDSGAGAIFSVRDVTERRHIEVGLRAAVDQQRELNALKTRFVSMVSHEYRTPLASILIGVDLLDRYYDRLGETRRRDTFKRVRQQIATMTGMLDDVLTINRAEMNALKFEPAQVDLKQLCGEIVAELQGLAPGHTITFLAEGVASPAVVDARMMRQIITNLTTNAVKYSLPDSTIAIQLSFTEDAAILSFEDHGIGIPEEDQPHLFEPFHRASNVAANPGVGLGLTIVKQAVDIHRGRITITSALGVGTRVTVVLPLGTEAPTEAS